MFAEAIRQHAAGGSSRQNSIGSGSNCCTYGQLPAIFEAFDAFFAGVPGTGDCLVFRCGNSLPEAVMLLWLLARKKNVLLLPRPGARLKEEFAAADLPQFCETSVLVDANSAQADIGSPASYLAIAANTDFAERSPLLEKREAGALFLRTSGSTAAPKLVMHSQEQLAGNALNCVQRFGLSPHDRLLIPVPIFHMYGLGAAILPGVLAGASIDLLENTNVINYLDRERQFKPTAAFLTPPLIEMLLAARKGTYRYRLAVTAGARINESAYAAFEKRFAPLVNLYGSTELGAVATSNLDDPADVRKLGMIEPLPGVGIRVEEEILCRHPFGFEAYVDRSGQEIGERSEWFATRDLGRMGEGTRFKVLDRTDNSINRSGFLLAFAEVESLMEQRIPGIKQAAVFAREGQGIRGKKLLAFCEVQPDAGLDAKEIRARCFAAMMRHMVPDEVIVLDRLPRLPNNKVDRQTFAKIPLK